MAASKNASKAIRYTPKKKEQVLAFVDKMNAKQGRGGIASAEKKFGISRLTIYRWLKSVHGELPGAAGTTQKAAAKTTKKTAKKAATKKATKKAAKKAPKKAAKKVAAKATKKKAAKKATKKAGRKAKR